MPANEGSADDLSEAGDEELWEAERRSRMLYAGIAIFVGLVILATVAYFLVTLLA